MKKMLMLVVLSLLVIMMTACGAKPAAEAPAPAPEATPEATAPAPETPKTGGNLVVYSPNSEGLMNATVPLFEEKYGIKVEVIQAGTGELIKRLSSEKDAPYADVMFGGSFSQFYSNAELFQDYISPNDGNVIEAYQNTTGYTTSYVLDGSCLIVNKTLLGDIEVKGYKDLLNPELKGKIASADPANSSSAFAQLTNILLANGGYDNDGAWAYVKDLYTNIDGKVMGSSSKVYKSVADGEMVVGLTYEDPSAGLVRDGADVAIVYPEEGTVYLPATAAIVSNCENLENAKLFIDFIISEEIQNIYGTTLTNRPVIEGAEVGTYLTPISDIHVITEDIPYVNENKSSIVEKYIDIFTSIGSN
ncbi:ABC transporter substrate-binding protein [Fusibacter sp. 3D3]|uniref:ABC transporter substrate-binding protein n=1 Tax=Fusibacter sp. 3D3 TaxID=1048380 RepID=UPI000852CBF8|nr:ABC transporter substrate-binding protein [Fusibacter sp. 3D3]GAU78473.1 ferric iron ABC transporter [Fusibacter sp. 3D3]